MLCKTGSVSNIVAGLIVAAAIMVWAYTSRESAHAQVQTPAHAVEQVQP